MGDSESDFTVVRNNTFANKYHSGLDSTHTVLVEGNRFYDIGAKCDENPSYRERSRELSNHAAIYVMSSNSIVRNNSCDNNGWGIYFGAKAGGRNISDHILFYNE